VALYMLALDYMGKHKGGKESVIINYINIASIAGLIPTCFVPILCFEIRLSRIQPVSGKYV